MPILRKKRVDDKKRQYKAKTQNPNNRAVYNTNTWRNLRLQYLSQNPLCERCIKKGKINSAVEVHHKIPISSGRNAQEKKELGYCVDNLESLCHDCHTNHHKKNKD